ncbi:hypothetical protein SFUMM280S_09805 [Streptomyces fumanus]
MAGRGRVPGCFVVVLCLLLAALVGCGGGPAADPVRAEVQRVLDRRAAALLGHDAAGYAATGTRTGFGRVRAVPLADWSYRVRDVRRTGDRATADVQLGYRLAGHDRGAVTAARTLRLAHRAGQWYVTSERPAERSGQQPWDQGTVHVVRGRHSLVLGVGRSDAELRSFAALADRAVPAVSDAWDGDWAGRLVILVPKSLQDMAGLLGSPASSYRGIAAVTTGETGGAADAPADRIIVNPEAFGLLGSLGPMIPAPRRHPRVPAQHGAATPSGSSSTPPPGSAPARASRPPPPSTPSSPSPSYGTGRRCCCRRPGRPGGRSGCCASTGARRCGSGRRRPSG